MEEGEQLFLVFTSEYEPPGPPAEAFLWLFKAARALISEGVSDEDQIIPTLVFAHEIDRGAAGGASASSDKNELPLMPRAWETVKTVEGVNILEEVPIRADMLLKRSPGGEGVGMVLKRSPRGEEVWMVPNRVLIQVSYRKKAVEPKRVGSVYAEELAARGLRFDGAPSGSIDYEFVGNRLYLTIGPKKEPSAGGRAFPSPELVEAFYRGLIEVQSKRITARGKQFEVSKEHGGSNLVPASVAFLLRASGGIQGRKEIHRLLNDHVYARERFVEDGYATSETVQLWRDVPKAGTRIARMLPLFWGRPFSKHSVDY